MQEKKLSLNHATLVWWAIFWRTVVVIILYYIVVGFLFENLVFATIIEEIFNSSVSMFFYSLLEWIAVLVTIIAYIYFTRMAVNRDYVNKSMGSFRLIAIEIPKESDGDPVSQLNHLSSYEREKKLSLHHATLVWWAIWWRVLLVSFLYYFLIAYLFGSLFEGNAFVSSLLDWSGILVTIYATIYFTRLAINRNYNSKKLGSFRLMAVELQDESKGTHAPEQTATPNDTRPQ